MAGPLRDFTSAGGVDADTCDGITASAAAEFVLGSTRVTDVNANESICNGSSITPGTIRWGYQVCHRD